MKKATLLSLCLLLLLACACTASQAPSPDSTPTQAARTPHFALVVKSLENPYMTTLYEGFAAACEALGARATLAGPAASGLPRQTDSVQALLAEGVDAIAIAANDMDEVEDVLRQALAQGVPVVSLDSMVKPDCRMLHIQQASPEMIGRVLIQACAQIMGREGAFAILTTTDAMPNQASWLRWMHRELSDHAAQYERMTLVETAYGLDEYDASAAQTRRLLETYPGLKMIIAPTTVGMRAAADTLRDAASDVRLIGLGLPSEMEPFIVDGSCPWMYLWNPMEVGSLAAYAMHALSSGALTGTQGEILSAGTLGEKVVTASEQGGTEIVLGNPMVFDMTNIAVWSEVF